MITKNMEEKIIIEDTETAGRIKRELKDISRLRLKVINGFSGNKITPIPARKISKQEKKRFLGKRQPRTLNLKDVFSKDVGKYRKISKKLKTIQLEQEAYEMEYKEKQRLITERWKRALTKKFPLSVSFKVHDLPILTSRVVQTIPKISKLFNTKFLKTQAFLTTSSEIDILRARSDLGYSGWTFEELTHLGLINVKNTTNHALFVQIVNEEFPRKSMVETLQVYDLIKKSFNIRFYKVEWKKANDEEKIEIEKEYKSIIMNFLCVNYFATFPLSEKKTYLKNFDQLRITFDELKVMFS